jgi:rubrerythrin
VIDVSTLDLRGAFDFAVMIEEDAQLRYEQLARLAGDDPGGAGDVFRMMAVNERKHRSELLARREQLFRGAPPRIDVSLLEGGAERPLVEDDELPRTAREALEVTLAAEQRAHAFYRDAAARVEDAEVRSFFLELMQEEAGHGALLAARIARLGAGEPAEPRAQRAAGPPGAPPEPYPDRALLASILPRFDAATQAVAKSVIVEGVPQEEVAAALGVSRGTVARKLMRFLQIARQHLAVALAAAALAGCEGGSYDAAGRFVPSPAEGGGQAQSSSPQVQAAYADPQARAPAWQPSSGHGQPAPDAPAQSSFAAPASGYAAGGDGSGSQQPADPFSRTPPTAAAQPGSAAAAPAIAGVSPSSGGAAGGEEVLITGSGFANVQVLFGDEVARVTSQSSNAITVIAPPGAAGATHTVVVTNRDGSYAVARGGYAYR